MTPPTYLWICGYRVPIDGSEMRHITLEKVALAMSWTHRFNGQFGPASLTDHSCRVADLLPGEFRMAGLVHDIAEIVTGDIAAPVKHRAGDLPLIEERWRDRLLRHLLGDDRGDAVNAMCRHHLVKECDTLDYAYEVSRYTARDKGPMPPYDPAASARRWMDAVRREI